MWPILANANNLEFFIMMSTHFCHARFLRSLFLLVPLISIATHSTTVVAQDAIIANHGLHDITNVPACWVDKAKQDFKLSYGHTSHGSQIISGMDVLDTGPNSQYHWNHDGTDGGMSLWDRTPNGDLGHNGSLAWYYATRDMLDQPDCDRNVVMWSWCGGASDNTEEGINIYLTHMDQIETDYPDVTCIYMTGHLDGSGEEGNLNIRNNQIREYCNANGKILFDFADIESYNPDGDYFLDLYANDNCDYNGGNWAAEWCDENPGNDMCDYCSCAHSQSLNCNMKGRTFWWMMARMAGWDGEQHPDCNDNGFPDDYDIHTGTSQDNNGNGIPDECEDNLTLNIENLIAEQTATFTVTNGTSGEQAVTVYGLQTGETIVSNVSGYCATFTIANVNQGKVIGGLNQTFDATGTIIFDIFVPANAAGQTVYFQTAEHGTCPNERISTRIEEIVG